jgi:leucyl aminopeptidase
LFITYLPVDLHRWDLGPGGDALAVPIWTDIRPLRGAAGLLDWRLCGQLSKMIREGRVAGAPGEKLLLMSSRIPWKRVLAVGVGASSAFGEDEFRDAMDCILKALHGIGATSLAIALPGRDIDCIPPERAMREFVSVLNRHQRERGAWLERLTIIDVPSATKSMSEAARALESGDVGI